MLNVAIAVDSAVDYGPQADRVVSAACEEVVGDRRCPVARDLPPGSVAAWYALVHPNDPGPSSLRIEFRDRTADGVLIEERALAFSARDGLDSRLASAGSVIAAMVAAREGPPARAPSPAAAVQTSGRPEAAERPGWSFDLAALLTPEVGAGPARWGGFGRAHLAFAGRLFGLVSAGAAAHPGNPGLSWWTLSAGGGARLGDARARVVLELDGELVVERTRVTAQRGAAQDSASQDGWGGRVAVTAVWAAWRHASPFLAVDGTMVLPRIGVVVAQSAAERIPAATVGVALGVRLQP